MAPVAGDCVWRSTVKNQEHPKSHVPPMAADNGDNGWRFTAFGSCTIGSVGNYCRPNRTIKFSNRDSVRSEPLPTTSDSENEYAIGTARLSQRVEEQLGVTDAYGFTNHTENDK